MSEKEFIINILKDYIEEKPTQCLEQMNMSKITDYAKMQNLEGIIYKQIKIQSLQKSYMSTIYNYINRQKNLELVEKKLNQNNIQYYLVKGFKIAELYPQPQLRTMGDCDLVVHSVDKEKVHEIMTSLGFECLCKSNKEWNYSFKNLEFEIHDHLVYKDERESEKTIKFFDNSWKHVYNNELEWNFHFIFLICHLRKHIMGTGVGLRQFLDLAIVIKKVNLDWDIIVENIKYLELMDFFKRVLGILEIWFDIEISGLSLNLELDFVEKVSEKIIDDGIFGFNDEENHSNLYMYIISKKGKIFAIKQLLHDIFLPYADMVNMKQYKFVRNKIYLMPVAWGYRLVLKWKSRDKIKKRYSVTDKSVDKRVEYLRQWGL